MGTLDHHQQPQAAVSEAFPEQMQTVLQLFSTAWIIHDTAVQQLPGSRDQGLHQHDPGRGGFISASLTTLSPRAFKDEALVLGLILSTSQRCHSWPSQWLFQWKEYES